MEIKFFPRDVVGKKPKKVGDTFKAEFFGGVQKFVVTDYRSDAYMAEMK